MSKIVYYSTNNRNEVVDFRTAFMNGLASNYGLYMLDVKCIPKISSEKIVSMREMNFSEIAFEILFPFVSDNIPEPELRKIVDDAYNEYSIPTIIQKIKSNIYILWLTNGPTYSFKDYAARFFGRILSYFLKEFSEKRVVIVATSGDTGGAVADALHDLDNIYNIVFFPKDSITERQRRQMTTLKKNVFAFEINGDFDTCQTLAKRLLGDKSFEKLVFGETCRFTSANSISIGRLLPQAVFPFFAYSKISDYPEKLVLSVPSGNFGNMMGSVLARDMGLPIAKILCGVNENDEFPQFLDTGEYIVKPSRISPSSAMIVSNPSNFARLIDRYGGHVFDERDEDGKIIKQGVMEKMPDLKKMNDDLFSISVKNLEHYNTIKEVYDSFDIIIEPHGAVGWRTLDKFLNGNNTTPSVVYETADPGKFPDEIKKAINIFPNVPDRIAKQANMKERIYTISEEPNINGSGTIELSDEQYIEAKNLIKNLPIN